VIATNQAGSRIVDLVDQRFGHQRGIALGVDPLSGEAGSVHADSSAATIAEIIGGRHGAPSLRPAG
jgi:hypothetical protein